jgi:putative endopeptidase
MRRRNKILPFLLSLVLFLNAGCTSKPSSKPETEELTCGQARDLIYSAATHYRNGLTPAVLLNSIPDGAARENKWVTRAEAFVMLDRAFYDLPEPVGDWLRIAPNPAIYSDMSDWARSAVDNLNKAGVLYVVRDNLLSGSDLMKRTELDTLLFRIYAMLGTNLKDDFYTAVNKDFLDNSTLTGNAVVTSRFDDMADKAYGQFNEILEGILSGSWAEGTPDRKIVDFYEAYVNMDARNTAGVAPLKPYLDLLDAAENLADLEDAQIRIADELAFYPFFNFVLTADSQTINYIITFSVRYDSGLANADIDAPDFRGDLKSVQRLFELAGDPHPTESARAALSMAVSIAGARYSEPLPESAEKNLKPYNMTQLQELFPGTDMKAILAATGLEEEAVYHVPEAAEPVIKGLAALYTEENIGALKEYAKYLLLMEYCTQLSQDFIEAFPLAASPYPIEEQARSALVENLGGYFDSVYMKRYFTKEAKQTVEAMTFAFIEDYKSRVNASDWLTPETKQMALKKLDTMVVKVGGMEEYDLIDNIDIRASDEGGGYFSNMIAVTRAKRAQDNNRQGRPIDRQGYWLVSPYEIAASYYPELNEIVISAAMLQAPFFSIDAPMEENLAGIGWVIAHEITHAFDVNGSRFDEYGNMADWWTKADKEKYQELCESLIKHYDGYEAAPGIAVNGVNTVSENTADLGGFSCALNYLKNASGDPDYQLFFISAARIWEATHQRDYLASLVLNDAHSPPKARVNKLVQNFQEFYDAFDIAEGDAMYISPERRVKIW